MSTEKKPTEGNEPARRTIPDLERILDLDDPTIDAELDQVIAERLGITAEELQERLETTDIEPSSTDPSGAFLRAKMAAGARRVGQRYQAKKNADA